MTDKNELISAIERTAKSKCPHFVAMKKRSPEFESYMVLFYNANQGDYLMRMDVDDEILDFFIKKMKMTGCSVDDCSEEIVNHLIEVFNKGPYQNAPVDNEKTIDNKTNWII